MSASSSSCRVCQSDRFSRVPYPGAQKNAQFLRFEEIELCSDCEIGRALPHYPQQELSAFYERGDYWKAVSGGTEQNPYSRAHEKVQSYWRVKKVRSFLKPDSKVLDIGCGLAFTAEWLEKLDSSKVSHFDFIEPGEAQAKEVLGRVAPFGVTRLTDLSQAKKGAYDLIFANHVVEHVSDPLEFLSQIRDLLIPGTGMAYIETPFSDYRYKSDVFPHTFFFTPKTFMNLGQLMGVETVFCESFGRQFPRPGGGGQWLFRLLQAGVRLDLWPIQRLAEDLMFEYDRPRAGDGIWVRWLFTSSRGAGRVS